MRCLFGLDHLIGSIQFRTPIRQPVTLSAVLYGRGHDPYGLLQQLQDALAPRRPLLQQTVEQQFHRLGKTAGGAQANDPGRALQRVSATADRLQRLFVLGIVVQRPQPFDHVLDVRLGLAAEGLPKIGRHIDLVYHGRRVRSRCHCRWDGIVIRFQCRHPLGQPVSLAFR